MHSSTKSEELIQTKKNNWFKQVKMKHSILVVLFIIHSTYFEAKWMYKYRNVQDHMLQYSCAIVVICWKSLFCFQFTNSANCNRCYGNFNNISAFPRKNVQTSSPFQLLDTIVGEFLIKFTMNRKLPSFTSIYHNLESQSSFVIHSSNRNCLFIVGSRDSA